MKNLLILIPILFTLSAAAQTNDPLLATNPSGQAIAINGKVYYKQATLRAKRSAAEAIAPALKRGDIVQGASQILPATVSGAVLVQLASPQDEAAIARDYGLTARQRTASVVVFDSEPQTDLLALQQKLFSDKRVKKAQLELASKDKQLE
ncbi:hypothetical protein [Chromobacterium sp. IIBBL 290-4]|uniref:hypothetical protein n=1 Tax=Chromobacterium sp. IIBBL 290-4 TaxID=2953890 RepID=UPI0020B6F9D1|nr:hypothetical protein [Chromobacterium sp. IIBBL 290-4]UTH74027.1 hypothetical protein NKT35_21160 [Chromobacterium sp. IIBBL 290-4]